MEKGLFKYDFSFPWSCQTATSGPHSLSLLDLALKGEDAQGESEDQCFLDCQALSSWGRPKEDTWKKGEGITPLNWGERRGFYLRRQDVCLLVQRSSLCLLHSRYRNDKWISRENWHCNLNGSGNGCDNCIASLAASMHTYRKARGCLKKGYRLGGMHRSAPQEMGAGKQHCLPSICLLPNGSAS